MEIQHPIYTHEEIVENAERVQTDDTHILEEPYFTTQKERELWKSFEGLKLN